MCGGGDPRDGWKVGERQRRRALEKVVGSGALTYRDRLVDRGGGKKVQRGYRC